MLPPKISIDTALVKRQDAPSPDNIDAPPHVQSTSPSPLQDIKSPSYSSATVDSEHAQRIEKGSTSPLAAATLPLLSPHVINQLGAALPFPRSLSVEQLMAALSLRGTLSPIGTTNPPMFESSLPPLPPHAAAAAEFEKHLSSPPTSQFVEPPFLEEPFSSSSISQSFPARSKLEALFPSDDQPIPSLSSRSSSRSRATRMNASKPSFSCVRHPDPTSLSLSLRFPPSSDFIIPHDDNTSLSHHNSLFPPSTDFPTPRKERTSISRTTSTSMHHLQPPKLLRVTSPTFSSDKVLRRRVVSPPAAATHESSRSPSSSPKVPTILARAPSFSPRSSSSKLNTLSSSSGFSPLSSSSKFLNSLSSSSSKLNSRSPSSSPSSSTPRSTTNSLRSHSNTSSSRSPRAPAKAKSDGGPKRARRTQRVRNQKIPATCGECGRFFQSRSNMLTHHKVCVCDFYCKYSSMFAVFDHKTTRARVSIKAKSDGPQCAQKAQRVRNQKTPVMCSEEYGVLTKLLLCT